MKVWHGKGADLSLAFPLFSFDHLIFSQDYRIPWPTLMIAFPSLLLQDFRTHVSCETSSMATGSSSRSPLEMLSPPISLSVLFLFPPPFFLFLPSRSCRAMCSELCATLRAALADAGAGLREGAGRGRVSLLARRVWHG
eukprot:1189936-Rhodomonas_salina.1